MNPKEYDVEELRKLAEKKDEPAIKPRSPDEAYLEELSGRPTVDILALRWAEYMVSNMGKDTTLKALDLYKDLGWISENVYRSMVQRIRLVKQNETGYHRIPENPTKMVEELIGTPFDKHAISLAFIAQLAGDDIEKMLNEDKNFESRTDVKITDAFAPKRSERDE